MYFRGRGNDGIRQSSTIPFPEVPSNKTGANGDRFIYFNNLKRINELIQHVSFGSISNAGIKFSNRNC